MTFLTPILLTSYALLALGAPVEEELTEYEDPWPEEEGHLNKTWEIALGVVVSFVVCAVIAVAIWVRIRRKRQQSRRTTGYMRSSNLDLPRSPPEEGKQSATVTATSKEDALASPAPIHTRDQQRRGPYR